MGKALMDFGATMSATLTYIGDWLGLYTAMAEDGRVTPAELAEKTNTVEPYVREWLINQAAGGYVMYDAGTGQYSLSPEQAVALADPESPFNVIGMFYGAKAMSRAAERIEKVFREGGGMLWGEHDPYLPAKFADRFTGARVRRFPDCGHWVMAESPDESARCATAACSSTCTTLPARSRSSATRIICRPLSWRCCASSISAI
jgi:hypothetical protein